jgi:hypothetical protein
MVGRRPADFALHLHEATFGPFVGDPLLGRLPVFTITIRRWLKAGVVELGTLNAATMGTQGKRSGHQSHPVC